VLSFSFVASPPGRLHPGTFAGYVVDVGNHFPVRQTIIGKDGVGGLRRGAGGLPPCMADGGPQHHLPVSQVYHFQYEQIVFVEPRPCPPFRSSTSCLPWTAEWRPAGQRCCVCSSPPFPRPHPGLGSRRDGKLSVLTTTQAKPAAALTAILYFY